MSPQPHSGQTHRACAVPAKTPLQNVLGQRLLAVLPEEAVPQLSSTAVKRRQNCRLHQCLKIAKSSILKPKVFIHQVSKLVFWFTTACFITFSYKLLGHNTLQSLAKFTEGSENRKWRRIFAFDRCGNEGKELRYDYISNDLAISYPESTVSSVSGW